MQKFIREQVKVTVRWAIIRVHTIGLTLFCVELGHFGHRHGSRASTADICLYCGVLISVFDTASRVSTCILLMRVTCLLQQTMGRVLTDEQRRRQNEAKKRYYAKKMVDPAYREK